MDITHLLYSCIRWWAFGWLLCFLAIINDASRNLCVQASGWMYVFTSLGYIARSGIAEWRGNSPWLAFRGAAQLFSKGPAPFCISASSIRGVWFFYTLANPCYYLLWLRLSLRVWSGMPANSHFQVVLRWRLLENGNVVCPHSGVGDFCFFPLWKYYQMCLGVWRRGWLI